MPAYLAAIAAVAYLILGLGYALNRKWRREDPMSYVMVVVFFGTLACTFGVAAVSL